MSVICAVLTAGTPFSRWRKSLSAAYTCNRARITDPEISITVSYDHDDADAAREAFAQAIAEPESVTVMSTLRPSAGSGALVTSPWVSSSAIVPRML